MKSENRLNGDITLVIIEKNILMILLTKNSISIDQILKENSHFIEKVKNNYLFVKKFIDKTMSSIFRQKYEVLFVKNVNL